MDSLKILHYIIHNKVCCCLILGQLEKLKGILVSEFLTPFSDARDLNLIGILPKQSYFAVSNFFTPGQEIEARRALVNLLFEELIDPSIYSKFKVYCRKRLLESFDLLSSMGEYNNDYIADHW